MKVEIDWSLVYCFIAAAVMGIIFGELVAIGAFVSLLGAVIVEARFTIWKRNRETNNRA